MFPNSVFSKDVHGRKSVVASTEPRNCIELFLTSLLKKGDRSLQVARYNFAATRLSAQQHLATQFVGVANAAPHQSVDNMASDSAALQEAISSALVSVTRSTSQLASEDIAFHRSLDPRFATLLDHQNARLLGLATSLLESATTHTPTVRAPSLTSADAVDNNWRAVVDVVDSLLERADTAIDEFTGAVKRPTQAAEAEVGHVLEEAWKYAVADQRRRPGSRGPEHPDTISLKAGYRSSRSRSFPSNIPHRTKKRSPSNHCCKASRMLRCHSKPNRKC